MKIAVAGGTGLTGRQVVEWIEKQGHVAVVLSRASGVDLTTGSGLADALAGVDTIIDVTNIVTQKRAAAVEFFESVSRNLVAGAERAGVGHIVALSIIGIDRTDSAYYAGKRAQEDGLTSGSVPWTILRAAQFHEFTEQMVGLVPGPIAVVPQLLSQPIAVREVAQALGALALKPAAGRVPELAGPTAEAQPDLARRLLKARGSHRLVLPIRLPGKAGKAMASGAQLPTGDGPRGVQTFDQWLAEGA